MSNNDTVKKVAAWSDGFFIDDLEAAKVVDEAEAFECGNHKVIEVPIGSDHAAIVRAITEAFKAPEVVE